MPAVPLFEHAKILHTLMGLGSAALADAVPYPGEATRTFRKRRLSTRKTKKQKTLLYCPGHAGVMENDRADRLAGTETITSGLRP